MYRSTFLLAGFLTAVHLFAAEGERHVSSRISEARVFLAGAQVTRTASATLPAGSTLLVFTGLAQDLDPQSIQVTGKGGYAILSVNHRMNYLTESPKKKEIEALQEHMRKIDKDWAYEKAMQDIWVNEEQLLGKNSSIGGQQNGLTAAQLTAVNDYVRERLKVTKSNWLAQQEKLTALQEEKGRLQQQLQQMQAQAPRPTSEVVVDIDARSEVAATFTLNYFVRSAGWTPAYDLRAQAVGQPIDLLMKAQVVNNTGEDWDKVELSLSSGNPTLGGVLPDLQPWTLYTYRAMHRLTPAVARQKAEAPAVMEMAGSMDMMKDEEATVLLPTTVQQRATTAEFRIDRSFSVPSDGAPHLVAVQSHNINASYTHYATPKLDRDAFLYARTMGWEDLNLLPGEANVFFEGTFVGKSFLQLDQPKDTLDISLGRDKGVVVDRVKRKSTNEKAVVGGKRTVTIGWDITVRNTKGTAVDLVLRDQYPLSPQSEVEVKLKEDGGATVNTDRGSMTWTLKLDPKATRKLGFSYEVKYPKDLPVVLE
ncbi:MAG: DUF4139 domain-containing protein [Flavobacteriales bacterium]